MEDFHLQSVLVTGSDRGIGLGFVQQLLKLPHPPQLLFATCQYPDELEGQVLKDIALKCPDTSTLVLLQMDVTNLRSIKEAARKVEERVAGRGLNLLINSAEVAHETTLASENAQSMLASYTTNTIGPMLVCQEFLPLLRRAAFRGMLSALRGNKATVVNVSSSCGSLLLVEGCERKQDVGYRCSKAALNMLTRCQALTYRLWGILCIAIHPGGAASQVGAEQEIPTMECRIRGILDVLAKLSAADSGTFLDWKGDVVPW